VTVRKSFRKATWNSCEPALPAVTHEVINDDGQLLVKQRQSYPRVPRTRFASHTPRRHASH